MMKQVSNLGIGQPVTACLQDGNQSGGTADKWELLRVLARAAEGMGLNHRTLSVLRALLSFFPDRALPDRPGAAVVFPSNASLSERLNGMPESTLRRHLAKLVQAGIVSRQDSPNRKRYARKFGLCYGFDLSPLARGACALQSAAEAAETARQRCLALRDRLALIRVRLIEESGLNESDARLERARLMLRRKADESLLTKMIETLEPLLKTAVPNVPETEEMSGSDRQNERHIQDTNKITSVSKAEAENCARTADTVSLNEVMRHCREYGSFFPDAPRTWHGVVQVGERLHGMLGIERGVYDSAMRRLGVQAAATTLLCMLEKIGSIRSPGAYLRGIVAKAERGEFHLRAMVLGCGREKLSADNFA
ncbi:plasmid replication protein RepC [Primorskyibacter sp. 2E107]|uniref:plasmid replication protein RepC n=1 Tax=Primorskyibacter sp. 2E107 TaxID=3403458 RepID=UPI003AF6E399